MKFEFPKIYPITDTVISPLSPLEQLKEMAAGGAALIQLREKRASAGQFFDAARQALDHARANGVRVIINDRVDIALLLKANGVHLGQNDLPPVHARRLLGEDAIIGYSTHSLSQAEEAVKLPIDYLAFGPIFPTSTKDDPDPVVGLELLAEIRQVAGNLPLIAIGGIDETNLAAVLAAGADSAAVIRTVLADRDGIERKVRSLFALGAGQNASNV
ncbi:MAG: thiamine phosphate synthase [Acidobacteria bacterium]|nr:thiamine phosphate synthase [Acidobacteriota bacterium]